MRAVAGLATLLLITVPSWRRGRQALSPMAIANGISVRGANVTGMSQCQNWKTNPTV